MTDSSDKNAMAASNAADNVGNGGGSDNGSNNGSNDGSPKFGRLLIALLGAVLLIVAITFASEAMYS